MDPSRSGQDLVWHHPCMEEIITNLVSETNRDGKITNSNLELAALVLHEATVLVAVTEARLEAPCSDLDNTPTVSWSTKEVSMINPAVADLIRIHTLHLRQFFINPSVFYHPVIKNRIADDASRLFEISYTSRLAHMSDTYPQLKSS